MIKEYNLHRDNFMGAWFIGEDIADKMMEHYLKNEHNTAPGLSYNPDTKNLDQTNKISTDLSVFADDDNEPILTYRNLLQECLEKYVEKYEEANHQLVRYNIVEDFNIQHYKPGEGFFPWHCERTGVKSTIARCFAFMTYLNDVADGGTEWKYQNLKLPAKKGLTVIWPADWTHTHRGIISQTSNKTIITGWYSHIYE